MSDTQPINLTIDLPKGNTLTPKGVARLLAMTVPDNDVGRKMLLDLSEHLESSMMELSHDGKDNASLWADGLSDALYNVATTDWRS